MHYSGTDPAMIELANGNALAIGAGHSFFIFFGQAFFPLNVLNAVIHSAPDPFMPELLIPVFFDEARSSFCILGQDTYAPEAASVLD